MLKRILPSLNARLSKQLTVWVFLSLVAVEAVLLLPSYLKRKQDLLQQQDSLVSTSLEASFLNLNTATPDRFNVSLASTVLKYLHGQEIILGGAIALDNSYITSEQGDYPTIHWDDLPPLVNRHVFNRRSNTYDTAIRVQHAERTVYVLVRYDGEPIHQQLFAYALRAIILVLVVAGVVTATTMFGVGRLVIRPILSLQEDLQLATLDIRQGHRATRFQSDTAQYGNELDSVIDTFKDLYRQIWQTIDERAIALQAERKEKERADQLRSTLEELHRTQAQLVQAERIASLNQLTAGMAHEINNPITFIHGNIPQLKRYLEDLFQLIEQYQQELPDRSTDIQRLEEDIDLDFLRSDYPQLILSLQRGASRVQTIVSSLKKFSRIDETGLKRAAIEEQLKNTVELLKPQLASTPQRPEIKVVETYAGVSKIQCYPAFLNQVFLSILTNAIEAMERRKGAWEKGTPPTIWIESKHAAPQWIDIVLRNNGPSLSASEQQRLFDPFYTTKKVGEGTGLSLFSCYQIIQHQHHGTLTCISQPGEDVAFLIHLPVSLNRNEREDCGEKDTGSH